MCDGDTEYISIETINAMVLLWNNMKPDERKAMADLMVVRHFNYLCTALRKYGKCFKEKSCVKTLKNQ